MIAASPLPRIDVVIVNFCTRSLVGSCLESLAVERGDFADLRAVVVDNDSGDGSAGQIAALIAARGWDWVELLEAGSNGGFGAGNNIGICWALRRDRAADL